MSLPNRKSIRLKDYDYSSNGAYFVTICTKDREMLFGDVVDGKMELNDLGKIVDLAIGQTSNIRENTHIHVYQIMPNHVHIIIVISGRRGVLHTPHKNQGEFNSPLQSPSQTVGSIIRGIKSNTTKQIRIIMENSEFPVWQRNYYEHIIRNEKDYLKISQYILDNPLKWEEDTENPNLCNIGT